MKGNTIESVSKEDCCGCYACMNICAKDAITMQEDDRGFSFPQIDHSVCIDCGLCYDRCPVNRTLKQDLDFKPMSYSLSATPEICLRSSSGGAFSLLANQILNEKGIVFGAKSNGLEDVWHEETDNIEGLDSLRRSKYFQSNIGFSFRKIKQYLLSNRKVLFVGTPCQVVGLKNYLGKVFDNLVTCDLICHGVPSKAIFRRFVKEIEECKKAKLIKYYRDTAQWAPVIFTCEYESASEDTRCPNAHLSSSDQQSVVNKQVEKKKWKEVEPYDKDWFNQLFHSNLIQRKSCRHCRFCHIPRVGEITLGDDWRYYNRHKDEPEKLKFGRSYVIVNNKKGDELFKLATCGTIDLEIAGYLEGGHINIPPVENPLSERFFRDIKKRKVIDAMWDYTTKKTFGIKFLLFMQSSLHNTKMILNRLRNKYKK